jgi:predicted ester cyclase
MGTQENAAIFQRVIDELVSKGNFAIVDELFAPNFVEHNDLPAPMRAVSGRETAKQGFRVLRVAFPDLHAEVHQVVAQGEYVVVFMTWHGTQNGEFLGIPPTGKSASFGVFDMVRVVDGKITDHWGIVDQLTAFQQLDVIALPGGGN